MVQNSWRINDLPSHVSIVQVSNKQRLGGESIRLDIYIRTSDLVDERRFADIGVSTDQEGSSGRVYSGKTGDMLTDLLKVSERVLLTAHDSGHAAWDIHTGLEGGKK